MSIAHDQAEIFENGFLRPRHSLMFAHMEIRIDDRAAQVEEQITYLYKLSFSPLNANAIAKLENQLSAGP